MINEIVGDQLIATDCLPHYPFPDVEMSQFLQAWRVGLAPGVKVHHLL